MESIVGSAHHSDKYPKIYHENGKTPQTMVYAGDLPFSDAAPWHGMQCAEWLRGGLLLPQASVVIQERNENRKSI